jgi:hypothetical protein
LAQAASSASPLFTLSTQNTSTAGAHTHTLTINSDGAHTHTVSVGNTGSGTAHNNLQPFILGTAYVKL